MAPLGRSRCAAKSTTSCLPSASTLPEVAVWPYGCSPYSAALKKNGHPGGMALGHATGDGNAWTHWLVWTFGGRLVDEDNKVVNPTTGEKVVGSKRILFWSLPELLIITLKRFSNAMRKNKCLVDFPREDLDLSPYVVGYDSDSYVYDLYGVCNHSGGVLGGHYTSFIRNANGRWYHYNDTHVSAVQNDSQIKSPLAYCFFYRKKIR